MNDIDKEYDDLIKSADNILTDEQVEQLNDALEENAKNNSDIQLIRSFASNQNIDNEEGYNKKANIIIDPNTGENKIVSTEDTDTIDEDSFEKLVKDVEEGKVNVEIDNSPITREELDETLSNVLDDKFNISDESIQVILELANRKMNKEEFNVYKAFPDEIKEMIDKYMGYDDTTPRLTNNEIRSLRNSIAESLLDEFIMNVSVQRARTDLNKEVEDLFKQGIKDITEYSVGYTKERNQAYREYVENMEDEDKKKKLTEALDVIDSAYNLDTLKEFAKTCKIKKYDIEQPKKYFRDFLAKYQNSNYNIYDIKLTLPILERKIVDNEKYNSADVIAFLVCFCKYIKNFDTSNILEHTYMYYVIYNIVIMDSNTSESTKEVSDIFAENIREVIDNLKERNTFLK